MPRSARRSAAYRVAVHRIETLRPGDIDQRDELARLAFGMAGPRPADRPRPAAEQSIGAYAGERLVANVTTLADAHWFGGEAVSSGGVTTVVVAPDQRGRNLAREVVAEAIRRIHERGDAISVLYPTTATLYRSLGYEFAGWYRSTDLPIASLERVVVPADVTVDLADASDAERAYDAAAPSHDGWLWRSHAARQLIRYDHDHLTVPKASYRAVRDGEVVGALVYSEVSTGPLRPFDLVASQLCATDVGALRALLAVAGAHGTMGHNLRTFLPPDDLVLAVPHGQRMDATRHVPWMLRIVDAPTAIAQRGYPEALDLEVHLHLHGDDLVPSNNGLFVLRIRDGRGELDPGGRGTVTLDIRELAAAYTGLHAVDPTVRLAFTGRPPTLVDFF
jgi:predicted acetyltransferase